MTRINCVDPAELHQKHLVAEYRELPRLFSLIKGWQERDGCVDKLPKTYRLGAGHVKFFYDKALWLAERQMQLVLEMQRRGYNPQHTNPFLLLDGIQARLLNDWMPDHEAQQLNRERIKERLPNENVSRSGSPGLPGSHHDPQQGIL